MDTHAARRRRHPRSSITAGIVLLMASTPAAAEQSLRLPVTRDTWFSNVGDEADCNTGGSSRLKLKSIQEMSLVDVDPAPLAGQVIRRATLHLRVAGAEPARRVTVSSFASPWVEGTAARYEKQAGSSTHRAQRHPEVPWAFPGSDLTAVMLGQGGTLWGTADASPPDEQGWQQIHVDPRVLAARSAGLSYGLLIFDDTGSEWQRQGEQFTHKHFPNRFFFSRDQSSSHAPYFTVEIGPADREPPGRPDRIEAQTVALNPLLQGKGKREGEAACPLPAGEAWASWRTPPDRGPAGTLGFFVSVKGQRIPQYLVPPAGAPGQTVRMRLRDLNLQPGEQVSLSIQAVDAAGNIGEATEETIRVSEFLPAPLPGTAPDPFRERSPLPQLGTAKVAVIDALDKVDPVTGQMIPPQPADYLTANHLFSAGTKQIRLAAARNEFVTFQVLIEGAVQGLRPSLDFDQKRAIVHDSWSRFRHVRAKSALLPDPLVPLAGAFDVPSTEEPIAGQTRGSLLGEIYVPHDVPPGDYPGTLTLETPQHKLTLSVQLRVWDFTLPDYLSFLPEMNCYGLPENERAYYRLAHRHRTVINRLPYSQSGHVAAGCGPRWGDGTLDWSAWDQRFGPLLDGTAFADLPRRNVPLEIFYLPLHENWPSPMEGNYNGDDWADRAFRSGYREAFVSATRQFAEHFAQCGWQEVLFQCFLNNKIDFKRGGWSRGSSPWLLDEPANFQDYWALRYFGEACHEGLAQARTGGNPTPKIVFRADISRPEWQRDSLDHVLDYLVVGGHAFRRYNRVVLDRKQGFGQVVVDYGTTNAVEQSNLQPVGWCLDSWTLGSDGVVPWQTIGRHESWQQADPLALFYPGSFLGQKDPYPSIRLKAYCRGQQDVEYLTLLAKTTGQPRWAIGQAVRAALRLKAEHQSTGFPGGEDAGAVHFAELRPQDLWRVREQVAAALSAAHPEPLRRLVDFRTPPRATDVVAPCYVPTPGNTK